MSHERVQETTWMGARALTLADDAVRVTVLPEHGARIVSLVYLPTLPNGRELLWTPPDLHRLPALPLPTYAMPYADHPAVGIDECIPTIWADTFAGLTLPDHGEVWSVPWDVPATATDDAHDTITTHVTLRQTPFQFTRRLSLVGASTVRLDYTLTNNGDRPHPALWALHPLMRWQPGMRVTLPPTVTTVEIGSVDGTSPLPPYTPGASWPLYEGVDLSLATLNTDGAPASTKLYAGPLAEGEGWATLTDPADGFTARFAFPTDPCRYLGLWLNRGAWGGYTHLALEPATGTSEFLSEATTRNAVLTVPAGGTATWYVTITLGGE